MIASNESIAQSKEKKSERAGGEARKRFGPSIDGSNHTIVRVGRGFVARIHRAYAVGMALPSPRPRAGWKKAGRREKREERREKMAAS